MRKYEILLTTLTVLFLISVLSCNTNKPLKIGLIVGLSGSNADLGEAGRNGAMLAVEQRNQQGGLSGRKVELLVRDDGNDPEIAVHAAKELLDKGVIAIVGAMSSHLTDAILTVSEPADLLQISPSASAYHFTGKDDNLIRLNSSTRENAKDYAEFMVERRNYQRINVLMDVQNLSFTQSWYRQFQLQFENYEGYLSDPISINSSEDVDYDRLVTQLLENQPDALLFIANTVDVVRMAQQIRKVNQTIPIVPVEWAGSITLIELGGKAVEGMEVLQAYNPFGTGERYLDFVLAYQERFLSEPDYASILNYESMMILLEALEKQKKSQSLKESILENSPYKGLQQQLEFDPYGDLHRESTFVIVQDKRFKLSPP